MGGIVITPTIIPNPVPASIGGSVVVPPTAAQIIATKRPIRLNLDAVNGAWSNPSGSSTGAFAMTLAEFTAMKSAALSNHSTYRFSALANNTTEQTVMSAAANSLTECAWCDLFSSTDKMVLNRRDCILAHFNTIVGSCTFRIYSGATVIGFIPAISASTQLQPISLPSMPIRDFKLTAQLTNGADAANIIIQNANIFTWQDV